MKLRVIVDEYNITSVSHDGDEIHPKEQQKQGNLPLWLMCKSCKNELSQLCCIFGFHILNRWHLKFNVVNGKRTSFIFKSESLRAIEIKAYTNLNIFYLLLL